METTVRKVRMQLGLGQLEFANYLFYVGLLSIADHSKPFLEIQIPLAHKEMRMKPYLTPE